jgi:hypothetical protein
LFEAVGGCALSGGPENQLHDQECAHHDLSSAPWSPLSLGTRSVAAVVAECHCSFCPCWVAFCRCHSHLLAFVWNSRSGTSSERPAAEAMEAVNMSFSCIPREERTHQEGRAPSSRPGVTAKVTTPVVLFHVLGYGD